MSANDQDHRIAEYIRGTADSASAEELEMELLEDNELFSLVEAEDLLHRGLRTTDLREPANSEPRRAPRLWPGYALAGALSLVVAILGVRTYTLTGQLDELQLPTPTVPVITLYDERSLLSDATRRIDATSGNAALLEIDVSAHAGEAFDLELDIGGEQHRWQGIGPDARGYLTVYVPHAVGISEVRVMRRNGAVVRRYRIND